MSSTSQTPQKLTPVQGIRRELQRNIRSFIAGESTRPVERMSEDGWFGTDSVTWLVQADWSTVVGGVESLLVQTLHPPTMAGVADHSDYREDMFGRLHRTVDFLGTTVFGSADAAQRSVDVVRAIHDQVVGFTPDGEPYAANDPRNLLWVHCTEIDGFLRAFRIYGSVPISDDEADQYVAEMARVGEALGIERAPRSVRELDDTLRSYVPVLGLNRQSRDALRFLLLPPHPLPARAPYAVILAAAVNMLPSWARRKLWLPPSIRPLDNLLVRPAAGAIIKGLDWIMQSPSEIEELRLSRRG